MAQRENCVTCLVEMCYPGCGGLTVHAFKKDVCGACFHSIADHSPERLAELKASYAKESKLDFQLFDEAEEVVRQLLGTLSELEIDDSPMDEQPDDVLSRSGPCPVCGGTTYSFAGDFALPCSSCPRPATPPTRRARAVPSRGSASSGVPLAGSAPSGGSAISTAAATAPAGGRFSLSKGRSANQLPLVGKLVSPRAHTLNAGGPSQQKPNAKAVFDLSKAAPAPAPVKEVVVVPEKPLLQQQKGFVSEWGVTRPIDSKCHIVDDDRYAPFYAHYFAKGKRKHAIFVGCMPDGEDPVLLALEQPNEEEDMGEAMALRGLLFTCKPLSKESDDRWVFLDPNVPMEKDLPEKKPALAGVRWKEVADEGFSDQLLNYEQKILSNTDRFKFGLLYVKEDQTKDENAMFQNGEGSESFMHFMRGLGEVVDLKGWDKYAGGLNVKDDTTGKQSLYTTIRGYQIMFHVSTFLPHRIGDDQCLDKKRHLGNDVVVIVFCDSENVRFDPLEMHSQFNHVFVVVVPAGVSPTSGKRLFRIAVIRKPGVPPIEPKLKYPGIYEEGDNFREIFLTKLINGERMSMYAPDFVRKMYRTRKELMNLLIKDVKTKKTGMFSKVLESSKSQLARLQARSSVAGGKDDGGASGGSSGNTSGAEDGRRSGDGPPAPVRGRSLAHIIGKRSSESGGSASGSLTPAERNSGSKK